MISWPGVHVGTLMELVSVGNSGVSVAVSDAAHVMAHPWCTRTVFPRFVSDESSSSSSIFRANFPHRLLGYSYVASAYPGKNMCEKPLEDNNLSQ